MATHPWPASSRLNQPGTASFSWARLDWGPVTGQWSVIARPGQGQSATKAGPGPARSNQSQLKPEMVSLSQPGPSRVIARPAVTSIGKGQNQARPGMTRAVVRPRPATTYRNWSKPSPATPGPVQASQVRCPSRPESFPARARPGHARLGQDRAGQEPVRIADPTWRAWITLDQQLFYFLTFIFCAFPKQSGRHPRKNTDSWVG